LAFGAVAGAVGDADAVHHLVGPDEAGLGEAPHVLPEGRVRRHRGVGAAQEEALVLLLVVHHAATGVRAGLLLGAEALDNAGLGRIAELVDEGTGLQLLLVRVVLEIELGIADRRATEPLGVESFARLSDGLHEHLQQALCFFAGHGSSASKRRHAFFPGDVSSSPPGTARNAV